jgi:hypothetical protein
MPTIEEWTKVHADLTEKLCLPCKLKFSTDVRVGRHEFEDDGTCCITVNLDADFRVPAHLILHEGAHHRICEPYRGEFDVDQWCHIGGSGHCTHWAQVLCDMYKETGIALPQTTSFLEFAKLAGVIRKNYVREGDDA